MTTELWPAVGSRAAQPSSASPGRQLQLPRQQLVPASSFSQSRHSRTHSGTPLSIVPPASGSFAYSDWEEGHATPIVFISPGEHDASNRNASMADCPGTVGWRTAGVAVSAPPRAADLWRSTSLDSNTLTSSFEASSLHEAFAGGTMAAFQGFSPAFADGGVNGSAGVALATDPAQLVSPSAVFQTFRNLKEAMFERLQLHPTDSAAQLPRLRDSSDSSLSGQPSPAIPPPAAHCYLRDSHQHGATGALGPSALPARPPPPRATSFQLSPSALGPAAAPDGRDKHAASIASAAVSPVDLAEGRQGSPAQTPTPGRYHHSHHPSLSYWNHLDVHFSDDAEQAASARPSAVASHLTSLASPVVARVQPVERARSLSANGQHPLSFNRQGEGEVDDARFHSGHRSGACGRHSNADASDLFACGVLLVGHSPHPLDANMQSELGSSGGGAAHSSGSSCSGDSSGEGAENSQFSCQLVGISGTAMYDITAASSAGDSPAHVRRPVSDQRLPAAPAPHQPNLSSGAGGRHHRSGSGWDAVAYPDQHLHHVGTPSLYLRNSSAVSKLSGSSGLTPLSPVIAGHQTLPGQDRPGQILVLDVCCKGGELQPAQVYEVQPPHLFDACDPVARPTHTAVLSAPPPLSQQPQQLQQARFAVRSLQSPPGWRAAVAATVARMVGKGMPFVVISMGDYSALCSAALQWDLDVVRSILTDRCYAMQGEVPYKSSRKVFFSELRIAPRIADAVTILTLAGSGGNAAAAGVAPGADSGGLLVLCCAEYQRISLAAEYESPQLREMLCLDTRLGAAVSRRQRLPTGGGGHPARPLFHQDSSGGGGPARLLCFTRPSPLWGGLLAKPSGGDNDVLTDLSAVGGDSGSSDQQLHVAGGTGGTVAVNSLPLLIKAAQLGNVHLVIQLLESGIDVNEVEAGTQRTALHYAAECGSWLVAYQLIHHGAFMRLRDKARNTPLALARRKRHWAISQLLKDVQTTRKQEVRRGSTNEEAQAVKFGSWGMQQHRAEEEHNPLSGASLWSSLRKTFSSRHP